MKDVYRPRTGIICPPVVVCKTDNMGKAAVLGGATPPAYAIFEPSFNAGQGAFAIGASGEKLFPLDEIFQTDTSVINGLYLPDKASGGLLEPFLRQYQPDEFFILSPHTELLQVMRQSFPMVRRIYDARSLPLNEGGAESIRAAARSCGASTVLLAGEATRGTIAYLRQRLCCSWIDCKTKEEAIKALSNGADGILYDDLSFLSQLYESVPSSTLVRRPFLVGHRGVPAMAPENSMEGAKLAYQLGADTIENDIYLSTDGELVVMHDPELSRTSDGSGPIESFSLKELQAFTLHDKTGKYPDCRIPTLEQYFEYFSKTGGVLFVEIKSEQSALFDRLSELLQKYDMIPKTVIITFLKEQAEQLCKRIPQLPLGFLCSWESKADFAGNVDDIMRTVVPMGATFNPNKEALTPELTAALHARGITTWPWTINTAEAYLQFITMGVSGITTNHAYFAADFPVEFRVQDTQRSQKAGDSFPLEGSIACYNDETTRVIADHAVILGDEGCLSFENGNLSCNKAGQAAALPIYTVIKEGETAYRLLGNPVFITITE